MHHSQVNFNIRAKSDKQDAPTPNNNNNPNNRSSNKQTLQNQQQQIEGINKFGT